MAFYTSNFQIYKEANKIDYKIHFKPVKYRADSMKNLMVTPVYSIIFFHSILLLIYFINYNIFYLIINKSLKKIWIIMNKTLKM